MLSHPGSGGTRSVIGPASGKREKCGGLRGRAGARAPRRARCAPANGVSSGPLRRRPRAIAANQRLQHLARRCDTIAPYRGIRGTRAIDRIRHGGRPHPEHEDGDPVIIRASCGVGAIVGARGSGARHARRAVVRPSAAAASAVTPISRNSRRDTSTEDRPEKEKAKTWCRWRSGSRALWRAARASRRPARARRAAGCSPLRRAATRCSACS